MDALTLAIILAVLVLGSQSSGPPAGVLPQGPPAAGARVLLIGDSLGVGLGPPMAQLGPGRFQNVSKGGTIIRQWAKSPRLEALETFGPSVVLVSLGTNDVGMSEPESEAPDLAALLARLRAGGRRVVWILPPKLPARYKAGRVRAMVSGTGVETFDSARLDIPQVDGIHATGAGYKAWAAAIWQAVGL